jgi:subtilisin family serine protease
MVDLLRRLRFAVFALAIVSLAAGAPPSQGLTTSVPQSKVTLGLRDALQNDGRVPVIVSLRQPASALAPTIDVGSVRRAVAAERAPVLASVTPAEFAPTFHYESIAALAGEATAEGIAKLAQRPEVTSIDVDGELTIATGESLAVIHATEVQDMGLTGAGVTVAVLDTGIDTDHVDLADSIAYERCFLSDGTCSNGAHPAEDLHGHGTNVAGIITSNGTVAPRGVAPGARIAAYRILNQQGVGTFANWLAALDDLITNHPEVKVINMSLQSSSGCVGFIHNVTKLGEAITTLRSMGAVTFASSGNHGSKDGMGVPACFDDVLSVGATYDTNIGKVNVFSACSDATSAVDQVACWSDSHPSLDLVAPGAKISSTGANGGTSNYYGTSQAAPHASAVAALLLEAFPGLSVDDIERRMKATGKLVTDTLRDNDPSTFRTTPRVDARVALLQPNGDYDGDGCRNDEEWGDDPAKGGRRNPLDPYDFFDVNHDGVVNLVDDVLPVIHAYGPSNSGKYLPELDRSEPPDGAEPWRQGPPDGTIDVTTDVLGVLAQFGHRCEGPS